jgi:hypothetical protein
MAVELCKVSLWINAAVQDRPLSFLDHHIRCGNSLIGATPELMERGVPYEAFDQKLTGNDRETTVAIRRRNRQENDGQMTLNWRVTAMLESPEDLAAWRELEHLAGDAPQRARQRYAEYRAADDYQQKKLVADCWTAAFFWPVTEEVDWVPTEGAFRRLQSEGAEAVPDEALQQIASLAEHYRFFHWHLEFPEIYGEDGTGGFDVVLGNPPWERVKLQEKEFFAGRDAEIAEAPNAAARRRLIRALPEEKPALWAAYRAALRRADATSHFLRESGRYPLTGVGDVNTYQVFAGLMRQLMDPTGRGGIIVPSGIATD